MRENAKNTWALKRSGQRVLWQILAQRETFFFQKKRPGSYLRKIQPREILYLNRVFAGLRESPPQFPVSQRDLPSRGESTDIAAWSAGRMRNLGSLHTVDIVAGQIEREDRVQ